MSDERWWGLTRREDLYLLQADERFLSRGETALRAEGWIPANETYFPVGATLLRTYLSALPTPEIDELMRRVLAFAERPRPDLPDPSNVLSSVAGAAARVVPSEPLWVDPARVFSGRDGLTAYFRDQGDWSRVPESEPHVRRNEPVRGLAEFAARIAAEHGDPAGLCDLFGPGYGDFEPYLCLQGWETPLGAVFRVHSNGNHRLAALAALRVPCVLAEVTWQRGPFDTTSGTNLKEDEVRSFYRTLLHAYGIAAFPDPRDLGRNATGIITQWPILIDTADTASTSLRAMETLTGRQVNQIGRLPRALFDDPAHLIALGSIVMATLDDVPLDGSAPAPSRRRRWLDRFRSR